MKNDLETQFYLSETENISYGFFHINNSINSVACKHVLYETPLKMNARFLSH